MKNYYASVRLNNLTKGLEIINKLNIGIELVFTPEDYFYEDITKINFNNLQLPKNKMAHLPFYGLQLGSKNPYISKLSVYTIKKAIKIASQLGIKKGVFHPALNPMIPKYGIKQWYKNFSKDVYTLINYADVHNFEIVAENTWEKDGTIFEWLKTDFKSLRFCLDVAHVFCFSNKNLNYWLKLFEGRISHLHLSDNNFLDDSHSCIGTKKIDFTKVPKNFDATIEVGINCVEKSINYLKSL